MAKRKVLFQKTKSKKKDSVAKKAEQKSERIKRKNDRQHVKQREHRRIKRQAEGKAKGQAKLPRQITQGAENIQLSEGRPEGVEMETSRTGEPALSSAISHLRTTNNGTAEFSGSTSISASDDSLQTYPENAKAMDDVSILAHKEGDTLIPTHTALGSDIFTEMEASDVDMQEA